jgi:hypothetical protein
MPDKAREDIKEYVRNAARVFPRILAQAGLEIDRLDP